MEGKKTPEVNHEYIGRGEKTKPTGRQIAETFVSAATKIRKINFKAGKSVRRHLMQREAWTQKLLNSYLIKAQKAGRERRALN